MNREIPGFYYDTTKRKYFRIEQARTAPATAAWSAPNVKRRAVEKREDESRRERLRRERGRVKRARVLVPGLGSGLGSGSLSGGLPGQGAGSSSLPGEEVLMGGLLAREIGVIAAGGGGGGGGFGGGRSTRGVGGVDGGEVVARAWAGGLKAKGSLDRLQWPGGVVSAMWIGGSDARSGLGLAYAVVDGACPVASYIPRDKEDRINFQDAAERYPQVDFRLRHFARQNQRHNTAIKFHEPSSKMLMAWEGITGIGIKHFTPRTRDPSEQGPTWVIEGDGEGLQTKESVLSDGSATAINALQPAPSGSRLTCIAGTNAGILQLQNDKLTWLTPPRPPRHRGRKGTPNTNTTAPWQGDVLSVDFLGQNPTEVILAGTRSGHVCVLDLRVPAREWSVHSNTFRHVSSAAHVRSVGDYGVLAAGPPNAMALYDVRYLRQRQQNPPPPQPPQPPQPHQHQHQHQHRQKHRHPPSVVIVDNATRPIVLFPHYQNDANIHAGLDILTTAGYGSCGIVATAHTTDVSTTSAAAAAATPTLMWQRLQQEQEQQRGRNTARANKKEEEAYGPRYEVALHSLRDGTRIPGGGVDGIRAPAVVKSLVWQTLPGDRHPSLFVGEGASIGKYSFWA